MAGNIKKRLGFVYGLKTKKGIALLQIVEIDDDPTKVNLIRVCNGFLGENYTEDDIKDIIQKKELFFLQMPLRLITSKSKIYKTYFAFDKQYAIPSDLKKPDYLRGFTLGRNGEVYWYKKRRNDNGNEYVDVITPEFLSLSPDACWNLPDLQEFLENGKKITDYI